MPANGAAGIFHFPMREEVMTDIRHPKTVYCIPIRRSSEAFRANLSTLSSHPSSPHDTPCLIEPLVVPFIPMRLLLCTLLTLSAGLAGSSHLLLQKPTISRTQVVFTF